MNECLSPSLKRGKAGREVERTVDRLETLVGELEEQAGFTNG